MEVRDRARNKLELSLANPKEGAGMLKRSSQVLGVWPGCECANGGVGWRRSYLTFASGWIPVTKDTPDANLCWHVFR